MIQKLTKQGDRWALFLDKATLDDLSIDTPLEVTIQGGTLIVTPEHSPERKATSKRRSKMPIGGMVGH